MRRNKAEESSNKTQPQPVKFYTKDENESYEATVSRNVVRPSLTSACAIRYISDKLLGDVVSEMGIQGLTEALEDEAKKVKDGDLSRAEEMLVSQAHTLDAMFSKLTCLGVLNTKEHIDAADRLFRLALKAQSQCSRTLEVLANIKNPPVVYARQANIANGPQQINNGTPPPSRTWETEIEPIKQSEVVNELLQDARASQTKSRANPALEALGEVHRAKVKRG